MLEVPKAQLADLLGQTVTRFFGAVPGAVVSRILSAIEQHPVPVHSAADRRKGGQFGAKLRKLQPYNHRLVCGTIYRQAFLWGVANYLTKLPHEELVVGFGLAEGSGTRIASVIKVRGDAETVSLPLEHAVAIHEYLDADERHTIIFVHNHPNWHPVLFLLSLFFGSDPLPSLTDRDLGLNALLQRVKNRLAGATFGRMRLFVVQNDAIAEFSGITAATLIDFIRHHYPQFIGTRPSN